MKKKFLTLILMASVSASVLAGCGNAAEPANSSNVVTNDAETADVANNTEKEPEPEPECVHEWSDATFARPKTCALCGETEGEPRQSYFEEYGAEVADAPVECTVNVVNYVGGNPEEAYQMVIDGVWEQIDCYSEPAEEEGYQIIHLELCETSQLHYYAAQDIYYNGSYIKAFVYDWYTGQMLPFRSTYSNDAFTLSTTLDIDGVSYDVSYALDVQWEYGDAVFADNGDTTEAAICYYTYTFKVPDSYDGLVFAAVPANEYWGLDTETVYGTGTEDGESASGTDEEDAIYAFDEDFYVDGTKFFRINRQEDSPITSGANDETDKSSARAVIDDGREQGSIGDSGLPYYRLGFSPEDFTIGGFSVYDGKNLDEMYDAIDMLDLRELKSNDGWGKQVITSRDAVVFDIQSSQKGSECVKYIDNSEKNAISFHSFSTGGHTIAEADFVESTIIPGKTSWNEAVDILGIRDLLEAMGVEGIPFEDMDKFAFESQYSEDSYCYIIWGNDDTRDRIYVGWTDEDGKEVCLALWFDKDDNERMSRLEISRTH